LEIPGTARLQWPSPAGPQNLPELYIETIKRVVAGILRPQLYAPATIHASVTLSPEFRHLQTFFDQHELEVAQKVNRNIEDRIGGTEWIPDGETMIGMYRLDNVHECIRDVISNKVPGDFIETGVWRGGATILMRACLAAYGDTSRIVWNADSFKGLPPPNPELYPADAGDMHHTYQQLNISREEVEKNFEKYGLLDDQVKFLEGWFKDTLAVAPIERLSVLRLDGDMYESTMDALVPLYPKLSVGGYAIIDDYLWCPPCKKAVEDYRLQNGITEPIIEIDRGGVYWKRER